MTVATETAQATFNWTGVEASFNTGIPIDQAADLKVTFTDEDDAETALTLDVHYSVAIGAGRIATVTPISLPAGTGTLDFRRETPIRQETAFANLSSYSPAVHERAHDLAAMWAAEVRAAVQGFASEDYVDEAIAGLTGDVTGALANLAALADAIGNDPDFADNLAAILSGKQDLDATLTALAGLAVTSGDLILATGADAFQTLATVAYGRSLLGASNAAALQTLAALVPGTNVQTYSAMLAAIAALGTSGLLARTGAGTVAARTLTAPAAGITVSNGDGVSGNPTLALANDLAAVEALATTGLAVRTGDGAWTSRSLAAPAAGITIADADGVAGNPTLALANDLAAVEGLTGQGMMVRTADNAAAVRALEAGAGVQVDNPNGTAGNLKVNLTFTGLSVEASPDPAADYVWLWDASANSGNGGLKKALVGAVAAAATAGVASFEGRTGAVTAAAGDYLASEVDNDSTVTGSKVADALDTLLNTVWDSASIADEAVTLAKLADLAEARVIGRAAGAGTGVPTALEASDLLTMLGITAAGLALIDDASAAAQRATLDLSYAKNGPHIVLQDQQTSGTAGGSLTSGAYRTRPLNQEVLDLRGECALSSNQFTLDAGTWRIAAWAPGYRVGEHRLQVYNVTDTAVAGVGLAAHANNANSVHTIAFVSVVVTIAAAKAFEIQHRGTTTQTTNGMGLPASFGTEVFCHVEITRIS